MDSIINKLRSDLKKNSDEKIFISGQRFFKEPIKSYGIKTQVVEQIGKKYFNAIPRTKKNIFALCDQLWQSGYLEESFIACHWSYYVNKDFEPGDFKIFKKWISDNVSNWASCDTLCNHTVGKFIAMYPEYLSELKKWAASDNLWMRRASAVSLIIPAKEGKFLNDIFDIADILLSDKEDLVQKGYGWMLKAASKLHQKEVFDYVIKNKNSMPRTALRYAIEKMPPEMKAKAMKR